MWVRNINNHGCKKHRRHNEQSDRGKGADLTVREMLFHSTEKHREQSPLSLTPEQGTVRSIGSVDKNDLEADRGCKRSEI